MATGYHGTSVEAAQRILSGRFEPSRNEYDWLGDGAYFFEDGPLRALDWARERFGADAAVIGAEIDLSRCIDLLDTRWNAVVREAYDGLLAVLAGEGLPAPRQGTGAHRLDRAVINHAAGLLEQIGMPVRSVRASFREGDPLYPGSALYDRAHVQICVRDPSAIIRAWRER
jgi:hypothetical protein